MINAESRVRPAPDVVSADLDGEVVIYNPDTGEYEQMNEAGSVIWKEIESEAASIAEICGKMVAQYDVSMEQCRLDATAFFNNLADKKLIETL